MSATQNFCGARLATECPQQPSPSYSSELLEVAHDDQLTAVVYHEAGHAVGAVLGSPPLVVALAMIVPDEDLLGRVTYEDWEDNIVPHDDEDAMGISEHERQHLQADDVVNILDATAEAMLRSGRLGRPALSGTGLDPDNIVGNAFAILNEDIF